MRQRASKLLLRGAFGVLFVGLTCLGGWPWSDAAAAAPDREPPVVTVQPVDPGADGGPLTVRAQVVDPSGIGNVVLWVRGELEEEYRQIRMERVGENQVEARVEPWPGQGSRVAYYIEARDALGNGPGYAGAPRTPYELRVRGAEPAAPREASTNWMLWGLTAGSVILLVVGYFLYRRIARERLHAALNAELQRLTGVTQESEAAMKAPAREPVSAGRQSLVPRNPAEQAFWIGLLSPISEMGKIDREHALQSMSVRAHYHPTLGKRFFDVGTLNRHLSWVERHEIEVTADMIGDDRQTKACEKAETVPG